MLTKYPIHRNYMLDKQRASQRLVYRPKEIKSPQLGMVKWRAL
jgi:hypothetical protein